MAVTVTHPFVSAIADGADATVVRPSNWNATHSLSGTVDVVNGGTGASTASITSFNNITGYTSSGATGTTSTNLVFSASPTFTGTLAAAAITASTTLGVTGTSTLSGNAIISVTDNTNAALRITQLGTGNALLVEDSTNPDASPFAISSSGQVVIGNTTATGFVPGVSPNFQVIGTDNASASTIVARYSADSGGPFILYTKSRGALGAQGIVSNGDTIGAQIWGASDGTTPIIAARIDAVVDGTPGTNDMPGRLVFSTTADGASSPTERMRIDSSGNLGLGVASVGGYWGSAGGTVAREVIGYSSTGTIPDTASKGLVVFNTDQTTNNTSSIVFATNNTGPSPIAIASIYSINDARGGGYGSGSLAFATVASGGVLTERMRIDSTGLMKVPGGISGGTF
jgi:hypothetical protein